MAARSGGMKYKKTLPAKAPDVTLLLNRNTDNEMPDWIDPVRFSKAKSRPPRRGPDEADVRRKIEAFANILSPLDRS
jgi:hypothetical protein